MTIVGGKGAAVAAYGLQQTHKLLSAARPLSRARRNSWATRALVHGVYYLDTRDETARKIAISLSSLREQIHVDFFCSGRFRFIVAWWTTFDMF